MFSDSSPPPASEDSAVGSISSLATSTAERNPTTTAATTNRVGGGENNNQFADQQQRQQYSNIQRTKPANSNDIRVNSNELILAAKQMRSSNVSLISRSVRTVLSCFDDLDIRRFESRTDYLINFVSNGVNKCSTVLRPVSILWPDSYEKMVEQLALLDAFLLNTAFREEPVDWMLKRGLTSVPSCSQCKDKMFLKYDNNVARWQCQKTQACSNYFMPVQRPSFFSSYENVGLDKLLFSIYFWSTCTPGEELYDRMNIEPRILDDIWRRIQNVCRTALEKSYPRHRLTDVFEHDADPRTPSEPIDLISIKLNNVFVVCAKHPRSNLVRLGLYIPKLSSYSFVDLTESWFAHGAQVRISENKFLDLSTKRNDLKLLFVTRMEMINKNGHYDRNSAFGYLVCQLTHVLKDFDSSTLTRETLKLVLAEIQWRELFGTTPFDAFTNIVGHMAQYGDSSDWYSEPSLPVDGEESLYKPDDQIGQYLEGTDHIWAERYFYATVDPIDANGKVISRYTEIPNLENPPPADVRIRCHECKLRFETFDFSMHIIAHVERKRKDIDNRDDKLSIVECKHCFKEFECDQIPTHSTIFRSHFQSVTFGCRICCIQLSDRSSFLQHMRRLHFEHETPYHCPSCLFASSFQRDVFIHFQEEHRHSMIILCPLCLRSFTVAKPKLMTMSKMDELSKIVHNHIAEHYVVSRRFTCNNCCLCFIDKDKLIAHKKLHHNVLEIRPTSQVKLQPFILSPSEEKYCIKAVPMELFIANKRPNLALDPATRIAQKTTKKKKRNKKRSGAGKKAGISIGSSSNDDDDDTDNDSISSSDVDESEKNSGRRPEGESSAWRRLQAPGLEGGSAGPSAELASTRSNSDDEESFHSAVDGMIHVRGLEPAKKFLVGGGPALKVSRARSFASTTKHDKQGVELSSNKLIDYLSKMKRADGILPNQSVILTPIGTPAKCCECFHLITADHFVAPISCKNCKYTTHCPRAAIRHNITHNNPV